MAVASSRSWLAEHCGWKPQPLSNHLAKSELHSKALQHGPQHGDRVVDQPSTPTPLRNGFDTHLAGL